MDRKPETVRNDDGVVSRYANKVKDSFQFLEDCEDLETEQVYDNLNSLWTFYSELALRDYLAEQTGEHLKLFEKFWYGLTNNFGSRFPGCCSRPSRVTRKGFFSSEIFENVFKKGRESKYAALFEEDRPEWPKDKETQVGYICTVFLAYFHCVTDYSDDICRRFGKSGYLEVLLTGLPSETLPTEFAVHITAIIYNCCRRIPENRTLCKGGIRTLENLSESSDAAIKSVVILTLSYIVDKTDFHKLPISKACIAFLLDNLKKALQDPAGSTITEWYNISVEELVQGIHQLAINDTNKCLIAKQGGIPLLEGVLVNDQGKDEDKCFAAQGIWQLAFNEDNRVQIRQRKGLIKALIWNKDQSTNDNLRDACSGALFVIKDIDKQVHAGQKSEARAVATSIQPECKNHIMISYQHKSQDIMLKVKAQLEEQGYTVWMDVDKMRGDILDAMANAVQQSAVVLVCMTLPFKESQHCRTEATYAYKMKKDIIPLLLQEGYVPEDWLGALLGMKKYFPMYSEEQLAANLPELIKELGDSGKSPQTHIMSPNDSRPALVSTAHDQSQVPVDKVDLAKSSPVSHGMRTPSGTDQTQHCDAGTIEAWGVDQVQDWLKKNGVNTSNKSLNNLNGVQLVQLFNCWRSAPEFCTTTLNTEFGLGLMDVAAFVSALKELFK